MRTLIKSILLKIGLYYKISFYYRNNLRIFKAQKSFYSQFILPDDIVFDVGANVGQRSEIFRRLCTKVIAIEPQKYCIDHLRSRFKFARNVIIEPIAIDSQPGETPMHESDSHTLSSMSPTYIERMKSTVFSNYKWDRTVSVKTDTLDHLISRYGIPSFIKIDVEGYEINVLQSLHKPVKCISIEFTPLMIQELKKCIKEINRISPSYQFNYTLGEHLEFKLKSNEDFDVFYTSVIDRELASANNFGDVYAMLP